MKLAGARVLVVGMEASGKAVVKFLVGQGAAVTASDIKALAADELGVPFVLQSDEAFDRDWDLIVASPGVPFDLPGLVRARARGVKVIGEVELAAPYLKGKVIGITGSNGKTTTTSLIAHILRESGVPVLLGGNIGVPVTDMIAESRADQWNVLELSSFQLETIETFRTHIAVGLNLTQNHLDRHYTMESYWEAKSRMFRLQAAEDWAVLNAGNEYCRRWAQVTPAHLVWFNDSREWREDGGRIRCGGETLMKVEELPIRGRHNAENVMAAAAASHLAGLSLEKIAAAVRTFKAVEHRLEFVRKVSGVDFYNDSKATSVDATLKALDSFPGGLWVILGGKDKGSDYRPLREPLQEKARGVMLIGAAAELIASHLENVVPVTMAGTLDLAVREAYAQARPGDTVLLAPACASFDQFSSYGHRGRVFKEEVAGLAEK
ncbi:MAG TPA: UDP-N-acetylmuramoyl-L-alanine--D-glutamate ligase [Bryobacteraceae bacterium]